MVQIETVAHAYRYERALTFHLSALVANPPTACTVRAIIYHSADDRPVVDALEFFSRVKRPSFPLAVQFDFRPLPEPQLLRRAIGRDAAARTTTADFILFADVDYLFGDGALDAIAEQLSQANRSGPVICYPRHVLQSIDHERGDAELARVDPENPQLIEIEPSRYEVARLPRVIGGCQWIPGSLGREKGYLPPGHRLLRPADEWKRTFCDRAAVRHWNVPVVSVDVPNVIRIRHSRRGRFDIGCRN